MLFQLIDEDIICCSFASGIFAHSWCILGVRLKLLKSLWSPLSDSPLHDAAYIFNRRQIWNAGRQISQAYALYAYEATLLKLVQNEAWYCPAEIDMECLGKIVLLTAVYVSKIPT